jgi:hypothetical protein
VADITVEQLASALEGFYVTVHAEGAHVQRGQIADADETAEALHATLSRMAALRHPWADPDANPDLCASCGNQFLPGQVCNACQDAEPHLIPLRDDPEINAIRAITGLLNGLPGRPARQRVMDYLTARFVAGPPF